MACTVVALGDLVITSVCTRATYRWLEEKNEHNNVNAFTCTRLHEQEYTTYVQYMHICTYCNTTTVQSSFQVVTSLLSKISTIQNLYNPKSLQFYTSTIQHLYNPTSLQSYTSTIQHLYNPTSLRSNISTIQHLYNPTSLIQH